MTTTQKSVLAVSLGIIKTKLYGLISVLVLVGAWEIIANSNLVSTILLPSPSQVITALFQLMVSGELLRHVLASVFRIILGFLVSALIAFPIGIWIALSPKAHHFLAPLLNISKYLPVVAFIPLTILWFGIGDSSKIFLLTLGTAPLLATLMVSAIERIPIPIIETAQTMGLSKKQLVWFVIIPYTAPRLLDALRLSVAIAWSYLTTAEIIAASSGLGHLIVQSQRYLQTDLIFAAILVISILGVVTDKTFFWIRQKFFGWEGVTLREKQNSL